MRWKMLDVALLRRRRRWCEEQELPPFGVAWVGLLLVFVVLLGMFFWVPFVSYAWRFWVG